jgi:hypothetical protein
MNPEEFVKYLQNASNRMTSGARNALQHNSSILLKGLMDHSPEDTGFFKSQWRISRSVSTSGVVSLRFTNNTPYSPFMTEGAPIGGFPWFHSGAKRSKNTGRFTKGSGKLKVSGGRVWAGGLKPGHNLTITGPINKVLTGNGIIAKKNQKELVKSVANSIIQALR